MAIHHSGIDQTAYRGGADVLSRFQQTAYSIESCSRIQGVSKCIERHCISVQREDFIEIIGGADADRFAANDLAGVLAHFVRAERQQANEFHVRSSQNGSQTVRADSTGGYLNDLVTLQLSALLAHRTEYLVNVPAAGKGVNSRANFSRDGPLRTPAECTLR